jgi:hypothetical protein
MNTAARFKMI